ncbi:MAG: DUF2207 domain-containing protein [Pseudomonadota bacterium]|nr:MAG: DUF2207 domain-containing protein [Pseudomonadota bacterium]
MKRLLLAFCLLPMLAAADERIVEFAADITIDASGEMVVTEHITVVAEGRQIRRGIYRDFPTRYHDRSGRRVVVPLEIVGVRRNGQPEDWHTESISNGTRIYFGSADRLLDHGRHSYELTYRTNRQIGFFDEFDELYWNVTGNAWDFRIEQAGAVVRLPGSVATDQLRLDAYTGSEGEQGQDYRAETTGGSQVRFETTRALAPREGLTIAVGFPKGLVNEPTAAEKRAYVVQDNRVFFSGLAGIALVLAWFLFAWYRVGRDPDAGAIYPRYDPPEGYSPGMLRYVWKMGYDRTCTAAALVSLAVKGALKLDKRKKDYVVENAEGDTDSLTERRLLEQLFDGRSSLVFKQSNHAEIREALKAHEKSLSGRMEGRYFHRNRWWLVPGVLLSILALLSMVLQLPGEQKFIAIFLIAHQSIWNLGTAVLVMRVYRSWRDLQGVTDFFGALLLTAFSLPFAAASVVVLGLFGFMIGWLPALVVLALGVVNGLFWHLLRAPTLRGRKLLDQVEGLKLYLQVAERDDFEQRHADAPPQTFEEFERLLPYAVALDCADTWAERFAAQIESAIQAGTAQSRNWYPATTSRSGAFSAASLGSALGSGLASATASAATAPGSSSGGGGGGFSGGGGGGGGGGGW